jgi:quercetin dioxygenase-like cupin family protein
MRQTAILLLMLVSVFLPAQQVQKPEMKEIFSGAVTLQRPQVAKLNVGVHLWTIRGGQRHAALEIPGKGTLVVQLRAGTLTTIISGRRQERKEGDFWTVPPGAIMAVETGQDTAVLQTILVAE